MKTDSIVLIREGHISPMIIIARVVKVTELTVTILRWDTSNNAFRSQPDRKARKFIIGVIRSDLSAREAAKQAQTYLDVRRAHIRTAENAFDANINSLVKL